MFGKKEEQFSFILDYRCEEKCRTTHKNIQECSMCGDVGFPDQLQQCTRCRFRFQHTYCCNSMEGLGTGVWMCNWCQLGKETGRNDRGTAQPTAGESAGALEFLLKAALNEAGIDDSAGGAGQNRSVDGGSFCPSGIESVKRDEVRFGEDSGDACWGSNRERMSERDEANTTHHARSSGPQNNDDCDTKRNPKLLRCNTKTSQKRRHDSLLDQQCGSVRLKRLSSLKGGKSKIACDPPKSFVRRYKSLSDISF